VAPDEEPQPLQVIFNLIFLLDWLDLTQNM
jgi:hypothetical protein